jgi:hypothetical protein
MRRIVLILVLASMLTGCESWFKRFPVFSGDTSTANQSEAIDSSTDVIESDAKAIRDLAGSAGKKMPNEPEPRGIENRAVSILGQVERIRSETKALEVKDQADAEYKKQLEDENAKLKEEQSTFYNWLYAAMQAGGVVGIAVALGMLWLGATPKTAIGVLVTSGAVLVMGITIPEYGKWIGLAGLVVGLGGMAWSLIAVRQKVDQHKQKIERDEQVKRKLVQSVQTALEHSPEEAMRLLSQMDDDALKAEIRRLKREEGLDKPRVQPSAQPAAGGK